MLRTPRLAHVKRVVIDWDILEGSCRFVDRPEDDYHLFVPGIDYDVDFLCAGRVPGPFLFSGASGSSLAVGALPEDKSDDVEDLFEYVVEKVAGYEPTDNVRRRNPSGKHRYHEQVTPPRSR